MQNSKKRQRKQTFKLFREIKKVKVKIDIITGEIVKIDIITGEIMSKTTKKKESPIGMVLPYSKPIVLNDLSDEQFDALMNQSLKEYAEGLCRPIEDFEAELNKEFGK